MSDTGGGHRASANALRDAFDVLYPGKIECDIVDIYSDYGNIWPYTDYPALYKIMAKYSFLWDWFYHFGATPFGLVLNAFLQEIFCFNSFRECLNRPSGSTSGRADMVLSVHPLCQDIPLRALANLDSNGETRDPSARTTPFVTVVTDLGGVSDVYGHSGLYDARELVWLAHWFLVHILSMWNKSNRLIQPGSILESTSALFHLTH